MKTALVWLRRDLRLHDNPALARAAAAAERVVPVFVWCPEEDAPWPPGAASRWWLHRSLAALDAALRRRGGRLVLRRGATLAVLAELARETGADTIYWNALPEPAARARDRAVAEGLRAAGVAVSAQPGDLLHDPDTLRTAAGAPYRVFTPFWRALRERAAARAPLPAPPRVVVPPGIRGDELATLELLPAQRWDRGLAAAWRPGEEGAWRMLDRFVREALADYPNARDRPDIPGTARLSPHLHFGELSPRQVAARLAALEAAGPAPGAAAFLRELGWREFAQHLLHHFPHSAEAPLDPRFEDFPWRRGDTRALAHWQRGRTGFPIVDAGQRELWATGWMHNRVRMITASFLTKNLLLPWQEGARWFWDTLVDADLASNTLGWQWSAGCGADAAPFFRIFNPVLQSRKFDPGGAYLRRWLPELAHLPDADLHRPTPGQAAAAGYPAPMVDLAATRARALEAWAGLRGRGAPLSAPLSGKSR